MWNENGNQPDNDYRISNRTREAPPRPEYMPLPNMDYGKYEKEMKESEPVSETLSRYFIFATSGLLLPNGPKENNDFLKALAINGGFSFLTTGSVSAPSPEGSSALSRIAMAGAGEAREHHLKTMRAIEEENAARIKAGEINIDTVGAEKNSEPINDLKNISGDIRVELEKIGVPEEQIEEASFDIIKAISLELFGEVHKADQDLGAESKIMKINELIAGGNEKEAAKVFHQIINSTELGNKVELLKERALTKWADDYKNNIASNSNPPSDN